MSWSSLKFDFTRDTTFWRRILNTPTDFKIPDRPIILMGVDEAEKTPEVKCDQHSTDTSALKVLDDLKEPPIVGETYLVNCLILNRNTFDGVYWSSQKDTLVVPLLGVEHTDPELKNHIKHIHIDQRFISKADIIRVGFPVRIVDNTFECPGGGLALNREENCLDPRDEIKLMPLKCILDESPQKDCYKAGGHDKNGVPLVEKLIPKGTKLKMDCKVCPHKGTNLDNIKPKDGKIVCPAHGLEWHAKTGKLLRNTDNMQIKDTTAKAVRGNIND